MQPAEVAGADWFPYKSAHLLSRPHVRKIASVDCGEHIRLVFAGDKLYRDAPNGITLFRGTQLLKEVADLLGTESDDWVNKVVVIYIDKGGFIHFGKLKSDTDPQTIEYTYDKGAEPQIYERIEKVVSGFDFIDPVPALLPCGSYVYPDKDALDEIPENKRTSPEWRHRLTGWMRWNPKVPGSGKHWQQQPCTGKGADRWIGSEKIGLKRTIGWMPGLWGCAVIDIDVNDHAEASDEDRQQIGDHRLRDTLDDIGVDPAGVIPSNSPGGWHIIVRSDQEEPSGIHEFGEIRCSSGQAVVWHPKQLLDALENIPDCESINWEHFLEKRPAKQFEITDPNHPNKRVRSTGMAIKCNTADEYCEALINAPATNRHDIGRSTCSSAFIKLGVNDEVRNALRVGLTKGPFGTKYDEKEIERTLRDSARFAAARIKERESDQRTFEEFQQQVHKKTGKSKKRARRTALQIQRDRRVQAFALIPCIDTARVCFTEHGGGDGNEATDRKGRLPDDTLLPMMAEAAIDAGADKTEVMDLLSEVKADCASDYIAQVREVAQSTLPFTQFGVAKGIDKLGIQFRLNTRVGNRVQFRDPHKRLQVDFDSAKGRETVDADTEWYDYNRAAGARLCRLFADNFLQRKKGEDVPFIISRKQIEEWIPSISPDVDPFFVFLRSQPEWDGVERLRYIFRDLFGVPEENEIALWISEFCIKGPIERTYNPGAVQHVMPVIVGPQGCGKSSFLESIFPREFFSGSFTFKDTDKDSLSKVASKAIVEAAELSGIYRKELEHVKQFLTTSVDDVRFPYEPQSIAIPRRWSLIGTANKGGDGTVLPHDPSGSRRFAVVEITQARANYDPREWCVRNRGQLIAEAIDEIERGAPTELPSELRAIQEEINRLEYRYTDTEITDALHTWRNNPTSKTDTSLHARVYNQYSYTITEVAIMAGVVPIDPSSPPSSPRPARSIRNNSLDLRLAGELKSHGWKSERIHNATVWTPPEDWFDEDVPF